MAAILVDRNRAPVVKGQACQVGGKSYTVVAPSRARIGFVLVRGQRGIEYIAIGALGFKWVSTPGGQ